MKDNINPLTSSDFLKMISIFPKSMPIANSMCDFLTIYYNSDKLINEYLNKELQKLIENLGGKLPKELKVSQLCLFKYNGKCRLIIDPNIVFLSLLKYYGVFFDVSALVDTNLKFYTIENEQDYEEYKKCLNHLLVKVKNELMTKANDKVLSSSMSNKDRQGLYEICDDLRWYRKNIDAILQGCINVELDYDFLLHHIHMFRFLGIICNFGCTTDLLSKDNWNDKQSKELAEFFINFETLLEFYNSQVPEEKQYCLRIQQSDEPKNEVDLISLIDDKLNIIPEEEREKIGYHDPKELLKNVLIDYGHEIEEKEKEERKAKRKEEFKELMLNWEIVPDVESLSSGLKVVGCRRSKKTEAEILEIELKREETLKRKLDLFSSLEYIAVLKGTNHFDGYVGYLFPNGKVILEKFYKSTKNGTIPVINEAVYVMNYKTFNDLSLCSKSELRDFISSGYYDDLKVINHTKNFENNVIKAITGNDYTDEILEYLEELVKENGQVSTKTNRN